MSLVNALRCEIRSISPLCRALLASTTFRDYTDQVQELVDNISNVGLETDTLQHLHIAISRYCTFVYDENPRRGNLEKYGYTVNWIIFLLPELRLLLNRARPIEKR